MAIPNRQLKPKTIAARERAVQALNLRKAGVSFGQIAGQLGYADESGARKAVQALLAKTEYEQVDEARQLAKVRLDTMLQGVYLRAVKGELSAIDRVLKIEERRAKLLGLDAPTKQDIHIDDWRSELVDLLKTGKISPDEVMKELGTDLATELFKSAGIRVTSG